MEYIREMLLRQRTALGRLMLGGGSAEEPETAAASPATERTSPAAPAPWETDGTASGTGGWEIRGRWGRQADWPHFGGGDAAAGPGPEACRMAVYGRLRTGWHRRDRRFCREAESHDGGWRSV